jgi:hypothetical protein
MLLAIAEDAVKGPYTVWNEIMRFQDVEVLRCCELGSIKGAEE